MLRQHLNNSTEPVNMILLLFTIFALTVALTKLMKIYSYWTDRGVKQRKQIYILGDNARIMLRKESILDFILNIYKAFPEERYIGTYQMLEPTLGIIDPELIKRITVKDFDHFADHGAAISDELEPLLSRNLMALKGSRWHHMRSTLSPCFTTSKMKTLFSLMSECATMVVGHLADIEKEIISIDSKDVFTRFTNDVIATSAFGIKCNSLKERENEFYMMGKNVANFGGFLVGLKFFLLMSAPSICKVFKIRLFDAEVKNFFQRIITETIRTREENNIVRPDMLHLLMEARKGKHKDEEQNVIEAGFATVEESKLHAARKLADEEITDLDIAAQAFIFFLAGFETVSNTMCFISHELAINHEIQKKLQKEIDETLNQCKGNLTYEALMKMSYMDMVVSETLRMWPPAPVLDRICVKPFTIEPIKKDERPIHLNVGDFVWIPVAGLHRDPKYFPNPDVFDPERFSDENKHAIQPYTYFPFGLGPRNCIGSRFALIEMKTLLFNLLSKFDFVPVERTQIPLKLKPSFVMLPENGFWIGLKRRTTTV